MGSEKPRYKPTYKCSLKPQDNQIQAQLFSFPFLMHIYWDVSNQIYSKKNQKLKQMIQNKQNMVKLFEELCFEWAFGVQEKELKVLLPSKRKESKGGRQDLIGRRECTYFT